jgi:hypothetical protein
MLEVNIVSFNFYVTTDYVCLFRIQLNLFQSDRNFENICVPICPLTISVLLHLSLMMIMMIATKFLGTEVQGILIPFIWDSFP